MRKVARVQNLSAVRRDRSRRPVAGQKPGCPSLRKGCHPLRKHIKCQAAGKFLTKLFKLFKILQTRHAYLPPHAYIRTPTPGTSVSEISEIDLMGISVACHVGVKRWLFAVMNSRSFSHCAHCCLLGLWLWDRRSGYSMTCQTTLLASARRRCG